MDVNNISVNNSIKKNVIRNLRIGLLFIGLLFPIASNSRALEDSMIYVESSKDYIEIKNGDGIKIELRYASTNNFIGKDIYGKFNHAYLHRVAAEKLVKAIQILKSKHPDYSLVIYDALRPRSIQYVLWNQVKDSQKVYVANPVHGSIHNYGLAVDITIAGANGNTLDMGTPYDDFSAASQPVMEQEYLKKGVLSADQIQNRLLLRDVMENAGFKQLPVEWWHFNALSRKEIYNKYKIVE